VIYRISSASPCPTFSPETGPVNRKVYKSKDWYPVHATSDFWLKELALSTDLVDLVPISDPLNAALPPFDESN
jgi:hypothetical protein